MKRLRQTYPEISCDLNAGRGDGYSMECAGPVENLGKLGLTLASAVGQRFTFNGGLDQAPDGKASDIMFNGVVVHDPKWGYVAVADEDGIYWRSQVENDDA